MQSEDTLPKLLLRNARTWPKEDAMREKAYGIWETLTWADTADEVRRFALGLADLGFGKDDKLAIIGDNRPPLYLGTLSAQSLGGLSLALYQDSIAKEIAYILDHSEASFVLAENEEQVDKLYEIRDQIPHVKQVIFSDPRGLALNDDSWLIHYPRVQERGDAFAKEHPGYFEDRVKEGTAGDVAILSYTSGTTGDPKGVMLSHENLTVAFREVVKSEGYTYKDEVLAYLPMAWIGDYAYTFVCSLLSGFTISCIESRETYRRDFREIGPTLFLGPPRQWENSITGIKVRMEEAGWLKRTLFETFMGIGIRVDLMLRAGTPVPFWLKMANALGDFLVRAPLRDLMGGRNMRMAYTGGAPLGPEVFDFARGMGINLKVLYAMTENAASCTIQPNGEAQPDTVGKPLPGVEIKIADNGEILMRGKMVFQGYFKNEKATREAKDGEGWFATGDAGFIDHNGHLKVIDRAKDVSKLNDGTLFAPQFLENKLKFSPYISEAVVLGRGKDYASAMINIDLESLENWAERNSLAYTNYQDLSQKEEVYKLIRDEIAKINETLANDKELEGAQVRRFLILNKELDPDDGEITRTRKLRRNVINERYNPLIEGLYDNSSRAETEVMVTYEDGRTGKFQTAAEIWDVSIPQEARP